MATSERLRAQAQDNDAASSSGSETSDILDVKDDEGWEDAEPDVEQETIISLLDNETFPDSFAMLAYCKDKYGFDFLSIRDRYALDFYGSIKLVNYIRATIKEGKTVSTNISNGDFEDEKYLKPVLEDDAFLFNLDELPEADSKGPEETEKSVDGSVELVARVAELEESLRKTTFQFEDYRNVVKQTLDDRWNENAPAEKEEKRDDDSHYFSSYSYNGMPLFIYL
jgi:protein arginine N-methyltransferase 3